MTRHIFMRLGEGLPSEGHQTETLRAARLGPRGRDHVWIQDQPRRKGGSSPLPLRDEMFEAVKAGDEVCSPSSGILAVSESDALDCFIKLAAKNITLRIASPPLSTPLTPADVPKFQAARLVVVELSKRRTASGRKTMAARWEARTEDPAWKTLVEMWGDRKFKMKDITEATGYPERTIHNAVERGDLPPRPWNSNRGRPRKPKPAGA